MQPIRWLRLAVITVLFYWTIAVSADHSSLANNGWRPIVGENRPDIIQKNEQSLPSKPAPPVQQAPKENIHKLTPPNNNGNHNSPNNKQLPIRSKDPNLMKHQSHGFSKNPPGHIRINHHGSSGHYMKHTSIQKQIPKPLHKPTSHPSILPNKMPPPRHTGLNSKRPSKKPHRPSHNHDELIAPAPSSAIGSYAYFNQGPFNVRDTQIRDTNKQFNHHDFRYNLQTANNDLIQHLHPHYSFGKHPSQNELHTSHFNQYFNHDDFTRNLVPPPKQKDHKDGQEKKILLSNPSGFILPQQKPFQDFQNPYQPIDLEITKEKIREFHTTVPPLYTKASTETYAKFTPRPSATFGYEVTEDKNWQENSPFFGVFRPGTTPFKPQTYPTIIPEVVPNNNYQETTMFLPTPFKPDTTYPTSPTQAEVSTIFSQLSQRYQENNKYNIKEVATHFPIFEQPQPVQTLQPVQQVHQVILPVQEIINNNNEVTTLRFKEETDEITQPFVKPTQETLPTKVTTKYPSRNRLNQRRRRPTAKPTTTTQMEIETEKPKRRRPIKYRPDDTETTRPTIRRKPSRITTSTEEPLVSENYPPNFRKPEDLRNDQGRRPEDARRPLEDIRRPLEDVRRPFEDVRRPLEDVRRPLEDIERPLEEVRRPLEEVRKPLDDIRRPLGDYNHQNSTEAVTEIYDSQYIRPKDDKKPDESVNRFEYEATTENVIVNTNYYEPEVETLSPGKRKRIRPTDFAVTNIKLPENELGFTTYQPTEEAITIRDIYQPEPEVTTLLTTTTSTEATTKSNRLRRPIKYDSHRPRFSVKDYRQRLNQYSSTTETTSKASENIGRIKYPSRFTKSQNDDKEDTTETMRQKFKPKDPRHRLSTTEHTIQESSTEKQRTRLRPFSRIRTTDSTVSSTTIQPKAVSIKSNIFSNLKRPSPISLRNRINKQKNTTTTTEPTVDNDVMEDETSTERVELTLAGNENKQETTTEAFRRSSENLEKEMNTEQEINDDAEAFLQLQRISELTSSVKNNPSYFKTMSSTSRRVPSYFKIATDDPILPIEAFFPNLNNHKTEQ